MYNLMRDGKRLDIPASVLPFTRDLIERCWAESPTMRPSFGEIWASLRREEFRILSGVDTAAVEAFVSMVDAGRKR
jgi:hypothetical protein